jgi:hypothetical protein
MAVPAVRTSGRPVAPAASASLKFVPVAMTTVLGFGSMTVSMASAVVNRSTPASRTTLKCAALSASATAGESAAAPPAVDASVGVDVDP